MAEPTSIVLITSLTSVAIAVVSRIRFKIIPSDDGGCKFLSGCTDQPLDHKDSEELEIEEFELNGGKKVLVITSKD